MKNLAKKQFLFAVVALAISLCLLAGVVFAWFTCVYEVSTEGVDVGVGERAFEAQLYAGQDCNRDGYLDRNTDAETSETEPYLFTQVTDGNRAELVQDFAPTQILTYRLDLQGDASVKLSMRVRIEDMTYRSLIRARGAETLEACRQAKWGSCNESGFCELMDAEEKLSLTADSHFFVQFYFEPSGTVDIEKWFGASFSATIIASVDGI